ncbi:MAG: metalloregulator ArsR/SmtB family transcription factor [Pseudomonadota bacterium]
MPKDSQQLDTLFRALADPTRRAVLDRLAQGPANVGALAEPFDMALPSFMQHLKLLEQAGLIRTAKSGRVRACSLTPQGFGPAELWLSTQRELWEGRFDRLEKHLTQGDKT